MLWIILVWLAGGMIIGWIWDREQKKEEYNERQKW